jgi:hypothetical protein
LGSKFGAAATPSCCLGQFLAIELFLPVRNSIISSSPKCWMLNLCSAL